MRAFLKKSPTIGLDIQNNEIRIVITKKKQSRVELEKFKIRTLCLGDLVEGQVILKENILRALVDLYQWAGQYNPKIVVALPHQAVITTRIQLPIYLSKKEMMNEIENNLTHFFPGISSELYFDYLIVRKDQEQFEILLFAIKASLLNNYLALLKEAGWIVKAVDYSILAMMRALSSLGLFQETVAMLDVHESFANWSIITKNDIRLQQTLIFENALDLQRQTKKLVDSMQRTSEEWVFKKLYIVGNSIHFLELSKAIPFPILHPARHIPLSSLITQKAPFMEFSNQLFAAYGLTLRR